MQELFTRMEVCALMPGRFPPIHLASNASNRWELIQIKALETKVRLTTTLDHRHMKMDKKGRGFSTANNTSNSVLPSKVRISIDSGFC
jgi:hypothetical protein